MKIDSRLQSFRPRWEGHALHLDLPRVTAWSPLAVALMVVELAVIVGSGVVLGAGWTPQLVIAVLITVAVFVWIGVRRPRIVLAPTQIRIGGSPLTRERIQHIRAHARSVRITTPSHDITARCSTGTDAASLAHLLRTWKLDPHFDADTELLPTAATDASLTERLQVFDPEIVPEGIQIRVAGGYALDWLLLLFPAVFVLAALLTFASQWIVPAVLTTLLTLVAIRWLRTRPRRALVIGPRGVTLEQTFTLPWTQITAATADGVGVTIHGTVGSLHTLRIPRSRRQLLAEVITDLAAPQQQPQVPEALQVLRGASRNAQLTPPAPKPPG